MKYNKLVRDKIPEIIKQKSGNPKVHIASEQEYQTKLNEKLQEEVLEYLESKKHEELADILEVIEAIAKNNNISIEELNNIKEIKAKEKGKFEKKIILDES